MIDTGWSEQVVAAAENSGPLFQLREVVTIEYGLQIAESKWIQAAWVWDPSLGEYRAFTLAEFTAACRRKQKAGRVRFGRLQVMVVLFTPSFRPRRPRRCA